MGRGKCPDAATSGFFNQISYSWMNHVVKNAKSGNVDVHELPLPTAQTSEVAYEEFNVNWEAARKSGNPNLRKVLWKTFGKDLMLAGLWKLLWSLW